MTKPKAKREREPKPPLDRSAFWDSIYGDSRRYYASSLTAAEMDALCRWWLKWREWERRKSG